jgi:DNA-nicking Smr family endonuclease
MAKDVDLFAAAMADVKPLGGRKRASTVKPPPALRATSPVKRGRVEEADLAALGKTASPDLTLDDQTFDRDTSRALGRGRLLPQASLDLHGMTLAAAERAVSRFIEEAAEQGLRIVLIVTGKGVRLQGGRAFGGRIRAEFLGWLNRADNRARVRGVRPAHPRHGGGGAFYVLLRRRSSASSRSLRATPQR